MTTSVGHPTTLMHGFHETVGRRGRNVLGWLQFLPVATALFLPQHRLKAIVMMASIPFVVPALELLAGGSVEVIYRAEARSGKTLRIGAPTEQEAPSFETFKYHAKVGAAIGLLFASYLSAGAGVDIDMLSPIGVLVIVSVAGCYSAATALATGASAYSSQWLIHKATNYFWPAA